MSRNFYEMLLKICHSVLEIGSWPKTKQSAIVINKELIITSGNILQHYMRPSTIIGKDDGFSGTKVMRHLEQYQLVSALEETGTEEAKFLNSLSYHVIFDSASLTDKISNRRPHQAHVLTRYRAKILYIFSVPKISQNMINVLDLNELSNAPDQALLSSFLVLTMRPEKPGKESIQRHLLDIGHYLRYSHPIQKLNDVLAICTPFGLENLYKCYSIGKVSNVMGDGSLFAISNALPVGCEGSAVFNNKLRLIGIIISTRIERNGYDKINITLVANFAYLLHDFMRQMGIHVTKVNRRRPSNLAWERALVVINANGCQGTGTFIKIRNKKFILTCSHLVYKVSSKVRCRSIDGEFESDVIWSNPHYNAAFDVALLAAPDNTLERNCAIVSKAKPCLGQTVYNSGFPYLLNSQLNNDFNPSIFQGQIIKCDLRSGLIISDGSVQSGQSGGPMFDQHGFILGICVSNFKHNEVVYPHINTAVAICKIRPTLELYAKTNDTSVLYNLNADPDIQRTWSLESPLILNKL